MGPVWFPASCNRCRFATTSGVRQGCVLAPALFLVAIDWILNHLAPDVGTTVGQHQFTDLTYADDAAIFMSDVTQAASTLQSFNTTPSQLHWISDYHGLKPHSDWEVSGASFLAPENLHKLYIHTTQVSCSRKWLYNVNKHNSVVCRRRWLYCCNAISCKYRINVSIHVSHTD